MPCKKCNRTQAADFLESPNLIFSSKLVAPAAFFLSYENSSRWYPWWSRDVCLDIDRAHGTAFGQSWLGEIPNESAVLGACRAVWATRPAFIFFRTRVARYAS